MTTREPHPIRNLVIILGAPIVVGVTLLAGKYELGMMRLHEAQKMFDELAPAGKAKASQLEAIAKQIPGLKQLDADEVTYSGPALTDGGNLSVLNAEELYAAFDMPEGKTPQDNRGYLFTVNRNHGEAIGGLLSLRRGGPNGWGAEDIQRQFGAFAQIEYVMVLKTLIRKGAGVYAESKTFEPGTYAGEVYLFRVADGKNLGGFRITATNSDRVEAGRRDENSSFEYDLTINIRTAFQCGVKRFVPGQLAFEYGE